MKRFTYFIFFLAGIATICSCGKDKRPQDEIDRELILQYIEDNQLNATEHPSGIFYVITEPGAGENPTIDSEVEVEYLGYFLDKVAFDGTTPPNTVSFELAGLIPGWQIAIPLLKRGGSGTFILPSELAYGRFPPRGFPVNAVLVFDIKLVDFQ